MDDDLAPRRKRFKLATDTYEETQEPTEGVEIKEKDFSIDDIE